MCVLGLVGIVWVGLGRLPRPTANVIHTHTTATTEEGGMAYSTNAAFDVWFQSAEAFAGSMLRHKTIPVLLMARCDGRRYG